MNKQELARQIADLKMEINTILYDKKNEEIKFLGIIAPIIKLGYTEIAMEIDKLQDNSQSNIEIEKKIETLKQIVSIINIHLGLVNGTNTLEGYNGLEATKSFTAKTLNVLLDSETIKLPTNERIIKSCDLIQDYVTDFIKASMLLDEELYSPEKIVAAEEKVNDEILDALCEQNRLKDIFAIAPILPDFKLYIESKHSIYDLNSLYKEYSFLLRLKEQGIIKENLIDTKRK